jgi:TRAP-type mannitol/chloroaromatic compound transport system substrate-binding protein
MQRRTLTKSMGMAGILAAGMAPAVGSAQQEVRWRLASSFPKSLDTIYGAAEDFSKVVSDLTGGKFRISVHAGGELMPPFSVVDGVQAETVELAHTASYYFFGKDPTFAISGAIPFGMNSRQMNAWMLEGNGQKLTREFYSNFNIVNFPGGNTGAQMAGWFRREIKTVEDLKGLKFRVGGFAGQVLTRLGVVPQNIPGGEIYQALEKGTIDAAEWIGPYDDYKLGFYKVAPNYYYPGWWEGGLQCEFYIGDKAFKGLSKEYRDVIEYASKVVHMNMQAKYDARNPIALRQLAQGGVKLHALNNSIMDAAFKEAMGLYEELGASNPNWKKIYTDYRQFQREVNLWFRFAESGFDRFMQAQRL